MASLLFLTQRIPYPPTKGEKIRAYRMLRYLAQRYEVHLGTLVDDPEDWQHVETVRALCKDAYFAPLDRRVAKLTCLTGLLTGEALSVVFFRNRGLRRWVAQTLEIVRPDMVFVCSGNMAPYVLDHRHRGRRIVDMVDVDSQKWRDYGARTGGPMGVVYRREARLMLALERRIAEASDATILVSAPEAALLRSLMPDQGGRIFGISNGVDCDYFDPAPVRTAPFDTGGANFVFTGTMDYKPNEDAVVWFARAILPVIRRSLPGAVFHIVGASPSAEVLRLGEIDWVRVTGRVADVRPYILHATACVAPLRMARGIQNKVLEAMAMGKAVIVTPEALAGIEAEAGAEVVLARDAAGFAAAAVALARAPDVAARIGQAARRRVEADYGWEARFAALDGALLGDRSQAARL